MRIRDARFPEDRAAAERFLMGSNAYEATFEPDRLLTNDFVAPYLENLLRDVGERHGRIFIAEDDAGTAMGWAVCYDGRHPVFVRPEERIHGYISEVFVEESARGQGVGQALIAACEAHFRARGHIVATIGLLEKNAQAARSYGRAGYQGYTRELRKYL